MEILGEVGIGIGRKSRSYRTDQGRILYGGWDTSCGIRRLPSIEIRLLRFTVTVYYTA
jgi:hypothetical protein